MSILTAFRNLFGSANGTAYDYGSRVAARIEPVELPAASVYAMLRSFYLSNGVYQHLAGAHAIVGNSTPQLRAIRNPIAPVVDFFSAKVFPDPLAIVTENEAIVAPIEQVWKWSNWQRNRRLFARYQALFGEVYTKTVADRDRGRVYFEVISPEVVTDFAVDERDYLTMIRLDVPQVEKDRAGTRRFTHTEIWVKDAGAVAEGETPAQYRRWRTEGDASNKHTDDLGAPEETLPLAAFGIDFVPFTRTVFRDIGEPRGIGAVQLALEAIVDADLSATNLHAMLYQDADGAWVATANGVDANGRPIPALRIEAAEPTFDALGRQVDDGTGQRADGSISVGKRSFWRLPGGYDLKSVVPDINYLAALAILKDHDEHLERLMPALAYARISELSGGDLSGRAIRFKLTPAIDQVAEVRASALAALVQADMQALTMGAAAGIPGFEGLGGGFESGAFEHTIEETEIIQVSDYEQAQTEREASQAFAGWTSAGLPMGEALLRSGYTEDRAEELVDMAAEAAEQAMATAAATEPARPDDEGDDDAAA